MKKILLLSLLLACATLNAQITLNNAFFPQVGDTLKTAVDGMPAGITITAPGGDQTWDYSSLQGLARTQVIQPASNGAQFDQFPDSEIVLSVGNGGQAGETYVNVTPNLYEFIGYSGLDPVGIGIEVVIPFSPSIIDRRSPMAFFDNKSSESNILISTSTEALPPDLLDLLPIVPDSVRVRVNGNRLDLVDGWGTLFIPGGEYSVLREKRITIQETKIEALAPIVGWLDVTEFIPFDFVGKDTTTAYLFFGNEKEVIANITVTNDAAEIPIRAEYKDNGVISSIPYVNTGKADIMAYPNPAINTVRFDMMNLSSGTYTLKLFNILGLELSKSKHYINSNNKTVQLDLTDFRKGTYLYSLVDANGKTISTKRLVIIRP